MAIELNENNFSDEVLKSTTPVLVDFWATWCMPCKMLAPTIDAVNDAYADKLKVCKLDVDKAQNVASKYGIMSIPAVLLFVKGEVAEQLVGTQPKAVFDDMLKKYIK
ncbi:thioredoxin [Deferribacterales bacterium RsTz2092]|nr:thioredoxin [Deferribacterales bacterium]